MCFVLAIAIILIYNIGLTVGIGLLDKQSEKNTTELTVTVLDVKKYEDLVRLVILTEEYENSFVLQSDLRTVNLIESKLKDETVIKIRIRNIEKKNLDSAENINCVSIKAKNEMLFSINDYNNSIKAHVHSMWEGVAVLLIVQVIIIVIVMLKKRKKNKALQEK